MSNLDEVLQYRKKLNQTHRQLAMAEGALSQAIKELNQKHQCKTIIKGKSKLKKLQNRHNKLLDEADAKLIKFQQKWKDQLED